MNILLFTDPHEDYLADAVTLGFRMLFGSNAVDYPKCQILYESCPKEIITKVRGNGFTLYSGLLEDQFIDRFNIKQRLKNNEFDLVIYTNIQRQFGLYVQYYPYVKDAKIVCLDGEDTPMPFPARGFFMRKPYYWFLPRVHRRHLYFKREVTERTVFNPLYYFLPQFLKKFLKLPDNFRTIQFGFPASKIITELPVKTKTFTKHIVDEEVASRIPDAFTKYAFNNEADYFKDIQESKFGITTKRSGWDCLRHYELAANGAVICFKDLDKKPKHCAPHGLNDTNCISYHNYDDLKIKIEKITDEEYMRLQQNSLVWVRGCSSTALAQYIINTAQV